MRQVFTVMSGLALITTLWPGSGSAFARAIPADPVGSVMWEDMVDRFFPDGDIIFDDRVQILAPRSAEDQFAVPITVDARGLHGIQDIVVVVDLNPIPHVLTYRPKHAKPFIGFQIKLEQGSPVHVGVKLSDGSWRLAAHYIDAAGGGCTAPAVAHSNQNWMKTLGETKVLAIREDVNNGRVGFRIRHPMDTGLADGIPPFYIENVSFRDEAGVSLGEIDLFEPVSENPTITVLPQLTAQTNNLTFAARDTEGNHYGFDVAMQPENGG